MKIPFLVAGVALLLGAGTAQAAETDVTVMLSGGYETYGPDRGRPVVLVAAGLGVPAEVFRKAFSQIHPAPAGQQPTEDEVRHNKEVLMDALSPLGVTDDRLNEVSNYYRYRRESGELWRHVPAQAVAIIQNGAVTGFRITAPGAGYSSAPEVSVPGFPDLKVKVTLWFGKDLARNGSVTSIELEH